MYLSRFLNIRPRFTVLPVLSVFVAIAVLLSIIFIFQKEGFSDRGSLVSATRSEPSGNMVQTFPTVSETITHALALVKVKASDVRLLIPLSSQTSLVLAKTEDGTIREMYVDVSKNEARLVTEHPMGPAPQYTYIPYDLAFDQAHIRMVNGWEGWYAVHDDYIRVSTGEIIALVDTYGDQGKAVVSNAHASTTIEYVYDGDACVHPKQDGKRVTVTGIRINGERVMPFQSPVQATCAYSEFSGEARLSADFVLEGYRVNPEAIAIQAIGGHSVTVPLEDLGDQKTVLLDY